MINKRGQVTIFIILALIIVVVIALAFVLIKKPGQAIPAEENPQSYLEDCVKKSLENIEQKQIETNLYPNATENYILYKNQRVKYLCKASMFYIPCINQEPMLVEYVRRNIEKQLKPEVEGCFSDLNRVLSQRGYVVTSGNLTLNVEFHKDSISANMNKKIVMKKNEAVRTFETFSTELQSPLFVLIDTARSIVNYESETCEFNSLNWEKNFPNIAIKRFITSEQTKVYTLIDKTTQKEINFAVKTCVLPAGI